MTSLRDASHGARLPGAANPVTPVPPSKVYERALTLAAMGFHEEATKALRDVTVRAPGHAPAWRKLAELLRLAGEDEEAREARARAANGSAEWPAALDVRALAEIDAAEHALRERMGELATPPEQLKALHDQLRSQETDVTAMRLLGLLEWQSGDLMTARALLERALDLAPDYEGARAEFAELLQTLDEHKRAVAETGRLVAGTPANSAYRVLHADALCAVGDFDSAIPIIEQLMREEPANVNFRFVYAGTLNFAGRREDSEREFRACLALEPGMAQAYVGLAQLRGNCVTTNDIAATREHLRDTGLDISSRRMLQYALGLALEQARDFSASFAAYEAAVALSQTVAANNGNTYYPEKEADQLARRRAVFTAPLLARAAPVEKPAHTPIFVIGMPRAGSTLVEQILASHSLVEGTMELPMLGNIVRDLSVSRLLIMPDAYPECVRDQSAAELAELGARYLEQADAYCRTNRPYFVDKRPWNWPDTGLIRLILPHAKIIDVRREPMAACFAMYKHMHADDAEFPYGFGDLAKYYTQYAGMMAHYDKVMPGHMHFLYYERLVEDTEGEIRRLLDYCGLPFEERCLRFWETGRAVATPSAQQVRRPIYRDALDQWRNFEPWLGPLKEALKEAETAAAAAPQPPGYEKALTLVAMSMYDEAIEELRTVTTRVPTHYGAWYKLAELLRWAGEDKAADDASAAADRYAGEASKWHPTRDSRTPAQLQAAERVLTAQFTTTNHAGQLDVVRKCLLKNPIDAAVTHMLSRLVLQNGDNVTSQALLERTLELAPLYDTARAELVAMYMGDSLFVRALEQTTILLQQKPREAEYYTIHCDALRGIGDFPPALAVTEELLREYPHQPRFWFDYGHLLLGVGRRDDAALAFRTCLENAPAMGEAYWGLAALKSGSLTEADVATMRAYLADNTLEPSSRMYMYYALGHALEQAGDYAASFKAYQQGARLFRGQFLGRGEAYREDVFIDRVRDSKRAYTARTFARCAVPPAASRLVTPIFVVGLPRAGSTLVEQILASHSKVEATSELALIADIVRDLALSRRMIRRDAYPDCVLEMAPAQLTALGERYLEEAAPYRKTERPCFIDKRPWNWLDAGLIHLILPQAKIIDIRREPMAACFAMFKQVLLDGADFSYDLRDLGHYYTEYVGLMEHWQSVMPGCIHFLQYERLVEDTESEIRRMLDYCGLPFEEGCLRFWETDRAVQTASAGQVRRPIYRDALQQWRNFEPWLGPLREALSEPARASWSGT